MTSTSTATEVKFKPGLPPFVTGHPGVNRRSISADGMRIEYDVPVPMRDGIEILVDIFRPDSDDPVPAIIAWSPYGKHSLITLDAIEGTGIEPGMVSKYCALEAPDPAVFCPEGFAVVNVDPRGTWAVPGQHRWSGVEEGRDEYDLIEWLAEQDWCTGKIGLGGVSYLAITQWFAAAERPPHLAAINPWEGVSDLYREHVFHGGIPEHKFIEFLAFTSGHSVGQVEDLAAMRDAHPLFDDYWATKRADLSQIDVPAYVVASWSDHGLHTRGTIEGFKNIASEHKYLEIHGRKKWSYYYLPENVARQKAFFARYLKDEKNDVDKWPTVRYEVRKSYYNGEVRLADSWPVPGTIYRSLHLDAAKATLSNEAPAKGATSEYDARTGSVNFDFVFDKRTEVVGNAALTLWVEAQGSDDMDLFVSLEKIDTSGKRVEFPFFTTREDGSVALGWLRASHRELDEELSTPEQPRHLHQREQRLSAGEIVPVQIEIWPSGTLFEPGDILRLVVQGHDIHLYDHPITLLHADARNAGRHVIHTGGEHGSILLLPIVST